MAKVASGAKEPSTCGASIGPGGVMAESSSGAVEPSWQPGCMRCDPLCWDGEENQCLGCGVSGHRSAKMGNVASSGGGDPALPQQRVLRAPALVHTSQGNIKLVSISYIFSK